MIGEKMHSPNPAWIASVKLMRVAAPAAFGFAVLLASLAYQRGSYEMMAIDAFCAGVNAVISWIQWCWFKL